MNSTSGVGSFSNDNQLPNEQPVSLTGADDRVTTIVIKKKINSSPPSTENTINTNNFAVGLLGSSSSPGNSPLTSGKKFSFLPSDKLNALGGTLPPIVVDITGIPTKLDIKHETTTTTTTVKQMEKSAKLTDSVAVDALMNGTNEIKSLDDAKLVLTEIERKALCYIDVIKPSLTPDKANEIREYLKTARIISKKAESFIDKQSNEIEEKLGPSLQLTECQIALKSLEEAVAVKPAMYKSKTDKWAKESGTAGALPPLPELSQDSLKETLIEGVKDVHVPTEEEKIKGKVNISRSLNEIYETEVRFNEGAQKLIGKIDVMLGDEGGGLGPKNNDKFLIAYRSTIEHSMEKMKPFQTSLAVLENKETQFSEKNFEAKLSQFIQLYKKDNKEFIDYVEGLKQINEYSKIIINATSKYSFPEEKSNDKMGENLKQVVSPQPIIFTKRITQINLFLNEVLKGCNEVKVPIPGDSVKEAMSKCKELNVENFNSRILGQIISGNYSGKKVEETEVGEFLLNTGTLFNEINNNKTKGIKLEKKDVNKNEENLISLAGTAMELCNPVYSDLILGNKQNKKTFLNLAKTAFERCFKDYETSFRESPGSSDTINKRNRLEELYKTFNPDIDKDSRIKDLINVYSKNPTFSSSVRLFDELSLVMENSKSLLDSTAPIIPASNKSCIEQVIKSKNEAVTLLTEMQSPAFDKNKLQTNLGEIENLLEGASKALADFDKEFSTLNKQGNEVVTTALITRQRELNDSKNELIEISKIYKEAETLVNNALPMPPKTKWGSQPPPPPPPMPIMPGQPDLKAAAAAPGFNEQVAAPNPEVGPEPVLNAPGVAKQMSFDEAKVVIDGAETNAKVIFARIKSSGLPEDVQLLNLELAKANEALNAAIGVPKEPLDPLNDELDRCKKIVDEIEKNCTAAKEIVDSFALFNLSEGKIAAARTEVDTLLEKIKSAKTRNDANVHIDDLKKILAVSEVANEKAKKASQTNPEIDKGKLNSLEQSLNEIKGKVDLIVNSFQFLDEANEGIEQMGNESRAVFDEIKVAPSNNLIPALVTDLNREFEKVKNELHKPIPLGVKSNIHEDLIDGLKQKRIDVAEDVKKTHETAAKIVSSINILTAAQKQITDANVEAKIIMSQLRSATSKAKAEPLLRDLEARLVIANNNLKEVEVSFPDEPVHMLNKMLDGCMAMREEINAFIQEGQVKVASFGLRPNYIIKLDQIKLDTKDESIQSGLFKIMQGMDAGGRIPMSIKSTITKDGAGNYQLIAYQPAGDLGYPAGTYFYKAKVVFSCSDSFGRIYPVEKEVLTSCKDPSEALLVISQYKNSMKDLVMSKHSGNLPENLEGFDLADVTSYDNAKNFNFKVDRDSKGKAKGIGTITGLSTDAAGNPISLKGYTRKSNTSKIFGQKASAALGGAGEIQKFNKGSKKPTEKIEVGTARYGSKEEAILHAKFSVDFTQVKAELVATLNTDEKVKAFADRITEEANEVITEFDKLNDKFTSNKVKEFEKGVDRGLRDVSKSYPNYQAKLKQFNKIKNQPVDDATIKSEFAKLKGREDKYGTVADKKRFILGTLHKELIYERNKIEDLTTDFIRMQAIQTEITQKFDLLSKIVNKFEVNRNINDLNEASTFLSKTYLEMDDKLTAIRNSVRLFNPPAVEVEAFAGNSS